MTPSEKEILQELLNCLIPPDDFPGAVEAGTGEFIEQLLAGDARQLAEKVQLGLEGLQADGFLGMDALQKEKFLTALESGKVTTAWKTDPAAFFSDMLTMTARGYYGDPGNGGNRDAMSWKMIGFDPRLPERKSA